MNSNIKVSIFCETYNQEKYIEECLQGIINQCTDFKFEVLIHDDASTDNTPQIIKKYEEQYPHVIKAIYQKENQFSKGISIWQKFQLPRAQGEYIAICEGDDYWIDYYKLQKQINFLEQHPNYGMVYSRSLVYYQERKEMSNEVIGVPISCIEELICGNHIPTLTSCMRKHLMSQYYQTIKPETHNWKMGDYPLWLFISSQTLIHMLPETTTVYRFLKESVSHSTDIHKYKLFLLSDLKIKLYFKELYNLPSSEEFNKCLNRIFYTLCRTCIKNGLFKEGKSYYKKIHLKYLDKAKKKHLSFFYLRCFIYYFRKKILKTFIKTHL